ncbi:MAG: hypothetical protein M3N25_09830 [Actinomycetota bacterium]|nr:hypothetical protein [Actinomycetota bacterium]
MTPAKAMALGWVVVVLLSACSGSPDGSGAATSEPASLEKGRAVCEGFFDDLRASPQRVEQAREASPRLGSVMESFAEVVAERDAGETPVEELEVRVNMARAGLEIVCADEFGVVPPAGYADPPPDDPSPVGSDDAGSEPR